LSRAKNRGVRVPIVIMLVLVIALGMASRAWPIFPRGLGNYPGDALWAMAVYFSLALLLPKMASQRLATVALIVSWVVEFAQLLRWPWLVALRRNPIGNLFLGSGFDWFDLLAYAVGVAIAFVLDRLLIRR
jgi:hypothetical protein